MNIWIKNCVTISLGAAGSILKSSTMKYNWIVLPLHPKMFSFSGAILHFCEAKSLQNLNGHTVSSLFMPIFDIGDKLASQAAQEMNLLRPEYVLFEIYISETGFGELLE